MPASCTPNWAYQQSISSYFADTCPHGVFISQVLNTWRCVSATCRWSRGAAARAGRQRHPGHPEAQQRDHLAGTQGERRTPAQAGDEDQDEDQQGGGGETSEAQTGEGEAGQRPVYSGATTTSENYCSCCVEGTRFHLIGCTESIRYRRYDPLCGIVRRLNNLKAESVGQYFGCQ